MTHLAELTAEVEKRQAGVTRRLVGYDHPDGPVRHWLVYPRPNGYSPRWIAACGSLVKPMRDGTAFGVVDWDEGHPRACRNCRTVARAYRASIS